MWLYSWIFYFKLIKDQMKGRYVYKKAYTNKIQKRKLWISVRHKLRMLNYSIPICNISHIFRLIK